MEGAPSKVLSIMSKVAPWAAGILGVFGDPIKQAQDGGIANAVTFMADRISHWKVPNLVNIIPMAVNLEQAYGIYPLVSGATAAIGGYILEEVGESVPSLSRIGGVIKRTGIAAFAGGLVGACVWLPAINPHSNFTQTGGRYMEGAGARSGTAGAIDTLYQSRGGAQLRQAPAAFAAARAGR